MGSDLSPWEFDVLIHGFQMGMVADSFFFHLGDKIFRQWVGHSLVTGKAEHL